MTASSAGARGGEKHSGRGAVIFLLLAAVALLPPPTPAEAQAVPEVLGLDDPRPFPHPTADPREPTTSASLIRSDLFALRNAPVERPFFHARGADLHGSELQADVSFGGHLPLLSLEPGSDGRVLLGIEGAIFGRFRLENTQNDLVGSDWIVALPVEAEWGAYSARVRLRHWSAHLGDEMAEESGVRSISYGLDVVDVHGAYSPDPRIRIYGGGSLPLRSTTKIFTEAGDRQRLDGGGRIQVGAEGRWWPFRAEGLALITALDLESASITEWRHRTAAVGGIEYRNGTRGIRLLSRFFDGPSPVGQFFGSQERFWGMEVQVEW